MAARGAREYSEARRGLSRREHWHRRSAVRGLERHADCLADPDRVQIAVDDVGHHRGSLGERDVGDRVGDRRATEDAIRIDRPVARGLHPLSALAAAERADRSRIPVWLVARRAALDQEPSLGYAR